MTSRVTICQNKPDSRKLKKMIFKLKNQVKILSIFITLTLAGNYCHVIRHWVLAQLFQDTHYVDWSDGGYLHSSQLRTCGDVF